jgi:hypothetical protein
MQGLGLRVPDLHISSPSTRNLLQDVFERPQNEITGVRYMYCQH